jgi:phage-related minor tail protein
MLKQLPNKPSGVGGTVTNPNDATVKGFAAAGTMYAAAAAAGMIDVSTFVPFAKGGVVTKPTLGLVGEAGPEAVIPLSQAGALGGGMVVNVTVNAGMGTDGKTVGDAIVNELKKWSRKNGKLPITTS